MIRAIISIAMIVAFWIMLIVLNAIFDTIGTIGAACLVYVAIFFILLNQ